MWFLLLIKLFGGAFYTRTQCILINLTPTLSCLSLILSPPYMSLSNIPFLLFCDPLSLATVVHVSTGL